MTTSLYPSKLTEAHLTTIFPDHWTPDLKQTVSLWLKDQQTGARPLTMRSIQTLRERFIRYTFYLKNSLQVEKIGLSDCLEIKTIYAAISHFPVESYSNRHNTFYAIHSLARFLVRLSELEEDFLIRLKRFRPHRTHPPKRTVIKDLTVLESIKAVINRQNFKTDFYCLTISTLIDTLVQTGLRNSEICNLMLNDVDLNTGIIKVQLGKGRKNRVVGVSKALHSVLEMYLTARIQKAFQSPQFFVNMFGGAFNPTSLARLTQKLSKLSGNEITTHGFRRAFATLNAEQGKPLHLIQLALGHGDLRTTQEYLMTDQDTLIEAMKSW